MSEIVEMRSNAVVIGSAAVLILVPALVLIWYSRKRKDGKPDRMDETQVVRKKKEMITKTTHISKEDVRYAVNFLFKISKRL